MLSRRQLNPGIVKNDEKMIRSHDMYLIKIIEMDSQTNGVSALTDVKLLAMTSSEVIIMTE